MGEGWGGVEVGAVLRRWFLERSWYKLSLRWLDSMIEDRSDNRARKKTMNPL